jgi:very-short-patch-repair endonuclease
LIENKILFERQKTFEGCINPKTDRKLRFDFYLPNHNMCIEYDGRQHFEAIKRFGGEKGYNLTIYRDRIKNIFCKNKNIEIMRIKYNEKVLSKIKKLVKNV